jgi:cell division protein FtsB
MARWESTRQKQKIEELQEKNGQLEQEKTALTALVAEL